jgi:hypothetical protein
MVVFCLSSSLHGLQSAPQQQHQQQHNLTLLDQQQPVFAHLGAHVVPLPHSTHTVSASGAPPAASAALPSRFTTSSAKAYATQQGEVSCQALTFAPVFRLSSRTCSSTGARAARAARAAAAQTAACTPPALFLEQQCTAVVAIRAPALAVPAPATPTQQQQAHPAPPSRKHSHRQQQQRQGRPWLGAALDVGGYTKRGWMRGGGKEHNQDRCVCVCVCGTERGS